MSAMPDARPVAADVARLRDADDAAPPAADPAGSGLRAIKGYSLPGEGRSTLISVATVIALFLLWWVATHLGWIKDLFLPTPE
jgi:taurine transport system permease protein